MAGRSGLGYRSVGGIDKPVPPCALCSGVSTRKQDVHNFGQRHLAAKGLAVSASAATRASAKREPLMGNFHQGEQIRRVGAIPLEQGNRK